jgi:hypothetical protein
LLRAARAVIINGGALGACARWPALAYAGRAGAVGLGARGQHAAVLGPHGVALVMCWRWPNTASWLAGARLGFYCHHRDT